MVKRPMSVRGLGITPAMVRRVGGRIKSPFKWPGSKNQPHYINPLRDAVQLAGGRKRGLDLFTGGANIPLNVPLPEWELNDYDWGLTNALSAIQNAPGGLQIDWGQHSNKLGQIPKAEYYENIRGGTKQGRGSKHFTNYWPPKDISLNALILQGQESGMDDNMLHELAKKWIKMQQGAFQGYTRTNQMGLHNIGSGAIGLPHEHTNPKINHHPYADKWDYKHYQPHMAGFNISNEPFEQFINQLEVNPKEDFGVIDPPFLGEPANYTDKVKGAASMDYLQPIIADWAEEQSQEGLPIVAFNSAAAQDMWADRGFTTFLNRRGDRTAGKGGKRGIRPEMIATNIAGLDADRWFRANPNQQYLEEDILGSFGKSQNPFEHGWSVVKQGGENAGQIF